MHIQVLAERFVSQHCRIITCRHLWSGESLILLLKGMIHYLISQQYVLKSGACTEKSAEVDKGKFCSNRYWKKTQQGTQAYMNVRANFTWSDSWIYGWSPRGLSDVRHWRPTALDPNLCTLHFLAVVQGILISSSCGHSVRETLGSKQLPRCMQMMFRVRSLSQFPSLTTLTWMQRRRR